jgi:hypothetical protein
MGRWRKIAWKNIIPIAEKQRKRIEAGIYVKV